MIKMNLPKKALIKQLQYVKMINKEEDTIYQPFDQMMCIETWILLHFIRFDTPINRKDCIKKLNNHFKQNKLGKYEKNDENLYERIKPYEETAIKNAKWLESRFDNNELPAQMNPCTQVHHLIEFLNKYI